MVPLPVDTGINHFNGLDDLAIHHWVPLRRRGVVSLDLHRKRIDSVPGSPPYPLLDHYTVYYEDQTLCSVKNQLIESMGQRVSWWGNILVVKHDGHKDKVIDMDDTDVALVNILLLRQC
jgi:hypothetical protein